jgi:hypothetical protein
MRHYRLVCDPCCAFRPFVAPGEAPYPDETPLLGGQAVIPNALRDHPELGPFVVEHEDCRPALRIAPPEDVAIEGYREHYEEA